MSWQATWQVIVSALLTIVLVLLFIVWGMVRELEPVDPTAIAEAPLFTGGCFRVKAYPPPTAHAAKENEFCIKETNGFWTLTPIAAGVGGMRDWRSVAGPQEIPLLDVRNDPGIFTAYFDYVVTGHQLKPPSSHGPQHNQPDFQFMVQVNSGVSRTATIKPRRNITTAGGPPVHGGSAHADEY